MGFVATITFIMKILKWLKNRGGDGQSPIDPNDDSDIII